MLRKLIPLSAILSAIIVAAPALPQCKVPAAKIEPGSYVSDFFAEDFFSVLERAKKEHKPIVVAVSPCSERLVDTLSSDINRRALAPFLKTNIPWTREETEKLPLTKDQKEKMRSLIEYGGGHLGWPVVLFLKETGESVGVGAYLSAEQFPFDLVTVYKALNIPVPPYLENAAKLAVEKIERARASDDLADFWSGRYREVIAMANKENKPIFVALVPVDSPGAKETLRDPKVRQVLSKFLKTRVGIEENQKTLEKALLEGSIGETVFPPVLPQRSMGRCTLGWPSWYFLDSKAKIVDHFNGYLRQDTFLEHCQKVLKKISKESN